MKLTEVPDSTTAGIHLKENTYESQNKATKTACRDGFCESLLETTLRWGKLASFSGMRLSKVPFITEKRGGPPAEIQITGCSYDLNPKTPGTAYRVEYSTD
tara:strand:+ start:245 stop:547 length:303 start_codon:yes stop_codon:yes gene_type:complete